MPKATPIVGPEPLTPEWFARRSTVIGASEAAKACGRSEFGTPYQLYMEKTGQAEPFAGNEHTRRGRRYEPLIAEDWQEITGRKLRRYPCPMFIHPVETFMSATPDGEIDDSEGLEIKCPTWRQRHKFGEEGTDYIPPDYVYQAQQQCAVMGWDRVCFAILIDIGEQPLQFTVERNDRMIALMIEAERDLIERIRERRPPEPDWEHATTPEIIKLVHKTIADTRIVLNDEEVAHWAEYERLGKVIKSLEEQRKLEQAHVLHAIGDHGAGLLPDGRMVNRAWREPTSYMVHKKGYVHVSAMKADGGRIVSRETTAISAVA